MTIPDVSAPPSYRLPAIARTGLWGGAAAVLLIPAIAMAVTDEVNWGPGDFLIMALLLAALCVAVDAAFAFARSRLALAVGIVISLAVFLAIWAELAVGIFD